MAVTEGQLAGVSSIGNLAQGFSQVAAGIAQERQANRNARLLRKLGIQAADDQRRATARLIGAQIAAGAASGGDPFQGSFLDLQLEAAEEGELAALRAKFGFESQRRNQRQAGQNALIAGIAGGTGTVLGGQTELLGKFGGQTKVPKTSGQTLRQRQGVAGVF
jgi:hypothetical protein